MFYIIDFKSLRSSKDILYIAFGFKFVNSFKRALDAYDLLILGAQDIVMHRLILCPTYPSPDRGGFWEKN